MNTWGSKQVILIALLATMCYGSTMTPAEAGFQKLRALSGDWHGKDEHGNAVTSRFEMAASNTAVMETLRMAEMGEDMLTLYSLDVNSIVLMHYCPTNNQPRMRALPEPGPIKQLLFSFEGVGNLPDSSVGHEHKLVIQFEDEDHIIERWTWRNGGTDTEMVFHLARKRRGKDKERHTQK